MCFSCFRRSFSRLASCHCRSIVVSSCVATLGTSQIPFLCVYVCASLDPHPICVYMCRSHAHDARMCVGYSCSSPDRACARGLQLQLPRLRDLDSCSCSPRAHARSGLLQLQLMPLGPRLLLQQPGSRMRTRTAAVAAQIARSGMLQP